MLIFNVVLFDFHTLRQKFHHYFDPFQIVKKVAAPKKSVFLTDDLIDGAKSLSADIHYTACNPTNCRDDLVG